MSTNQTRKDGGNIRKGGERISSWLNTEQLFGSGMHIEMNCQARLQATLVPYFAETKPPNKAEKDGRGSD